jgi:hypothetical protein
MSRVLAEQKRGAERTIAAFFIPQLTFSSKQTCFKVQFQRAVLEKHA